jgi:peptide/nickel transport system permease protein
MKRKWIHLLGRTLGAFCVLLIFVFTISRLLPGDPVERILFSQSKGGQGRLNDLTLRREKIYKELGLHVPDFYFSMGSMAIPDSFSRIQEVKLREAVVYTSYWSGDPVNSFILCSKLNKLSRLPLNISGAAEDGNCKEIFSGAVLQSDDLALKKCWTDLLISSESNGWRKWVPIISVNSDNKFHRWIFGYPEADARYALSSNGILLGDLGFSWSRGRQVSSLLKFPFLLSMLLAVGTIIVCAPLSLLSGAFLTKKKNSRWVRVGHVLSVLVYSMPMFWVAVLLLYFLASPLFLNLLPSSAPVLTTDGSVADWLLSIVNQWRNFVIPFVTMACTTYIYHSQFVYEMLLEESAKPYVVTLRAKGLSESQILFSRALKNILVPYIISLLNLFPVLIGGSIIMDYLFTLNGMGTIIIQACDVRDFPVIAGVLLIVGGVTILVYPLIDVLVALIDPRLKNTAGK